MVLYSTVVEQWDGTCVAPYGTATSWYLYDTRVVFAVLDS